MGYFTGRMRDCVGGGASCLPQLWRLFCGPQSPCWSSNRLSPRSEPWDQSCSWREPTPGTDRLETRTDVGRGSSPHTERTDKHACKWVLEVNVYLIFCWTSRFGWGHRCFYLAKRFGDVGVHLPVHRPPHFEAVVVGLRGDVLPHRVPRQAFDQPGVPSQACHHLWRRRRKSELHMTGRHKGLNTYKGL